MQHLLLIQGFEMYEYFPYMGSFICTVMCVPSSVYDDNIRNYKLLEVKEHNHSILLDILA
jgi:hypothetical protein